MYKNSLELRLEQQKAAILFCRIFAWELSQQNPGFKDQ